MALFQRFWSKPRRAGRNRHKQIAKLAKRLDNLEEKLDAVLSQFKHDGRWKAQMRGKIDALLRAEYLATLTSDQYPFRLTSQRFNLLCQNEEDGMILALLALAAPTQHTFVEIGSGNSGNTAFLVEELGWRGLMVEKQPSRAEQCARRFADPGRVACVCSEVTPDNINDLLMAHGFSGEVDLFSLDIDSFDYWVLDAMSVCSPRSMVLEYNAHFGPDLAVTIPRDASLAGAPKSYHGASLAAMSQLSEKKGYRLLACDMTGTNAFYLRNDIRPDIPAVPIARAFRRKRSPYDPFGEAYRDMDALGDAKQANLPLHRLAPEG